MHADGRKASAQSTNGPILRIRISIESTKSIWQACCWPEDICTVHALPKRPSAGRFFWERCALSTHHQRCDAIYIRPSLKSRWFGIEWNPVGMHAVGLNLKSEESVQATPDQRCDQMRWNIIDNVTPIPCVTHAVGRKASAQSTPDQRFGPMRSPAHHCDLGKMEMERNPPHLACMLLAGRHLHSPHPTNGLMPSAHHVES